jgi:hypothetical protein
VLYDDASVGVLELTVPTLDETWTFGQDDITALVTKGTMSWETAHFATGGTVELESGFVDDVSGRIEGDAASNSGVLRLTLDLHMASPAEWAGGEEDSGLGGGGDSGTFYTE